METLVMASILMAKRRDHPGEDVSSEEDTDDAGLRLSMSRGKESLREKRMPKFTERTKVSDGQCLWRFDFFCG